MSTKNDPAFPSWHSYDQFDDDSGKYKEQFLLAGGISKLEWFAGMALQGILANEDIRDDGRGTGVHPDEANLAGLCFKVAEAMLAESEKRK